MHLWLYAAVKWGSGFIFGCNQIITFQRDISGTIVIVINLFKNQLTQRTLLDLYIPVLSPEKREEIISQVEHYEDEIRTAQGVVEACTARKKAIIEQYLND